eukprot:TRINITY_DN50869_c0_g1_i1.p1 TRINITY_DN50869_c0_g1~~TRINITY_DN50869_c0_g1_i1.p1  ORF type:complete len:338 (-),score=40.50 TRINITY_DN50869_c0_g1_i1:162-1070(-)
MFPHGDVMFPNTVTYTCIDGASVGGVQNGATTYQLQCQGAGTFKDSHQRCREILSDEGRWVIEGFVKDATNNHMIKFAKVHIVMSSNESVVVETNAEGKYVARGISTGVTTFQVVANGFATSRSVLVAKANVKVGGGADFFLSPIGQAASDWRFILTWNRHPSDLDSKLVFSNRPSPCTLNYLNTFLECEGVQATLDMDERAGFGPETVTIKRADVASSTILYTVILYEDDRHPWRSLKESDATVAIYKGDQLAATMEINLHGHIDEVTKRQWYVARLDGGKLSVCTNTGCSRSTRGTISTM